MRYIIIIVLLLILLPAAGCGRTAPDDNGEPEADMDNIARSLPDMDAGELSPIMEGDNWHLRLAAGASLAEREDITIAERVELILQALEHEMHSPARGPVPSGIYLPPDEFARLHLAGSISELGTEAIPKLRKAAGEVSAEVRDYLCIALAALGDREAAPQVRDLLAHSPNPWLRMEAAAALGRLGDREAVPLLTAALQDPFMTTVEGCTGEYDLFPVRNSAAAALKALGLEVKRLEDGVYEIGG